MAGWYCGKAFPDRAYRARRRFTSQQIRQPESIEVIAISNFSASVSVV